MRRPLDGIKVLEITSWMAAPSAGAILADLGADVIKLEPLRGDAVRGMTRPAKVPEAAEVDHGFQVDNRGKRSIAVALDEPDGADLTRRLVREVDVFLTNLLPQRQTRYGLDPERLHAEQPTLVHATLTGYGLQGPDATRPGYDVTAFFGRGGITDYLTDPDAPAPRAGPAQGDHTTGLALVASVLAALRLVDATGEGQVVDTSLFATAVWTMATEMAPTLVDRRQPSRRGRRELISPLANRFPCGDGRWIILNMPEAHWWPPFCETLGHPEWVDDERFISVRSRFENMGALIDLIDAAFATADLATWGARFDAAGLIWGPAQTLAEVVDDPQAHAIGLFPTIEHARGSFETVASPLNIAGVSTAPRSPAPTLGEHTDQLLADLGVNEAAIADLRARSIVA